MSGKLQSGEVSSAQSYEATDYDIPSTDTEYQADENSVDLVTPVRPDIMAPRTRSQSNKPTEACDQPMSRFDSMPQVPAASSRNNAKRCSEDNHHPMQKRTSQYVNNGPADELQNLHDLIRQEREYINNRLAEIIQRFSNGSSDELTNIHDHLKQQKEYIEHRFAEEREQLYQEIDILKMKMSEGAKREKAAAEKITDDTIKRKWDTLRYNIRSVVLMLRSYEPKDTKHTLEILRLRISSASFAKVPDGYFREIFEGYLELYIWVFVYQDVFSGHGRQWRGNIFKILQIARREVISTEKDPKNIAELALWFSQGGKAVISQLDKQLQQPMADEFAESIFAMFQTHLKPTCQAAIKEVLGVVIHDATELVEMFMSSKALLLPTWPFRTQFGKNWPTTDFENERLPNAKSNDNSIVFRPALVKFGTADGEKHNVSIILCKPARLCY